MKVCAKFPKHCVKEFGGKSKTSVLHYNSIIENICAILVWTFAYLHHLKLLDAAGRHCFCTKC